MIDSRSFRFDFVCCYSGIVALAMMVAVAAPALGQRGGKTDEALKPRPVQLKTKDGADLNSFYFPSEKGKQAVPVIIIHEWKGQAGPYGALCLALRKAGFAVLALEYRGHGKSRTYQDPRTRTEKEYNIATMGKRDFEAIVAYDLEEAKQFLKKENNAGRLNLNALAIIGVEEGAILAMHWSSRDWRFPSVGRKKQGQDVKALVLVSPEKNHAGVAIDTVLRDANVVSLPIMVLAGKQSPQGSDSQRLGKRLETSKRRANKGVSTGLQLEFPSTNLSGAALIREVGPVTPSIIKFLEESVPISDTVNPWIERQ
ncbi:MAG: alpha/beta hydrolase [Planctomycetota bacterium]